MAYVPGVEYDLFISYASDDFDEKLKALIQDLHIYLRRELGKGFPEHGIFLDHQELDLTPSRWKQKLRESAKSAAILIPILTPSYASSDYCAKEWEWFCEDLHLASEARTQSTLRVCPVLWRALDTDMLYQLPEEIRSAQQQRTLSVEDLGAKIGNALRLMRRSRQTVYVGESEHEVRLKVQDEMSRMGFRVMPEVAMAYNTPHKIREMLGEARIAVHFVGNQSSQRAIEAIRWSRELCQFATVVYEIPGLDISAEEELELKWIEEDLNRATTIDSRAYDRISGRNKNFEQFLEVIRDRLEGVRPSPPTRIGIVCEDPDLPTVQSIIPDIRQHTGFSVICHGMSLLDFKKSRAILIYWGQAEGIRLRQARLIIRASCTLFLAPPPKPEESKLALNGCDVLHQHADRFDINDIRPFLERLGWRG